jgi:phosphate:Na+ symporter
MSEMQDNMERYLGADNEYIRGEYNSIRLHIAMLLRTLFRIDDSLSPSVKRERLRQLQQSLEEQDIVRNGTLDKLIREQRITSDMATSLMNDGGYAHEIQSNLIDAALALLAGVFAGADTALSEEALDKEILLRRDEILDRLRKEDARIDAITGREPSHPE